MLSFFITSSFTTNHSIIILTSSKMGVDVLGPVHNIIAGHCLPFTPYFDVSYHYHHLHSSLAVKTRERRQKVDGCPEKHISKKYSVLVSLPKMGV